ncbi:hypothetical protein [Parapedobacter tibetensis]|uniref:hypothetical protein n=1 Tax=Parapedobacter tibetensis TaxID=2972951 RepID=UPI00214D584F|nr:hypothetical protein [Parapedobacter tibetensis]
MHASVIKAFVPCFLIPGMSFTQEAVFKWEDELCAYESVYDSAAYSRAQIENAHAFLWIDSYHLNTVSVFKPEDIERLDLSKLEDDYMRLKTKLVDLDLPPTAVWQQIKRTKLNELDQYYTKSRIAYQAYMDGVPNALRQFDKPDSVLTRYADALITGGDDLLEVWHDLIAQRAPNNANPEYVWQEYRSQYESTNRLMYAKVYVLTFGWWNHSNGLIERLEHDEAFYKEFGNLFITTETIDCEEP